MRTFPLLSKTSAAVVSVAAVVGGLAVAGPAGAADAGALPPLTVLTDRAPASEGDLFIAPQAGSTGYASGAEVLSPDGKKVIWSHTAAPGTADTDFRKQTYQGKPVLTFWEGTGLGGVSSGVDYIYNDKYQKIAEIKAGNGYDADGHEFQLTGRGTALIVSYKDETADLTSIGGPSDQEVIDGVVQEVDVRTGKVLSQWDAAQHVPYSQSEQPLPSSASSAWDWFHVNAVKEDTDGNLLVDARNTWTTYKVNRRSGAILWRLGGKASSFTLKAAPGQSLDDAGVIFAWQHDPEPLGGNLYTLFDNESAGVANTGADAQTELPYSRVVTIRVDQRGHTATLVKSDDQPEALSASSQGNGQTLNDGNLVVGWGAQPYVSEFSRSGALLFNAKLPAGTVTYRAYRFDWK
jgi:Arylsulfotransferase (ASST)